MIAACDFRYGTDRAPSPWSAMVREPVASRLEDAPDDSPGEDALGPVSGEDAASPVPGKDAPAPVPGEDADDELYLLGERIAELAARINAAESRMMALIADFDRRGGWKDGGYGSCAEWLAWRIGIKIGPARGKGPHGACAGEPAADRPRSPGGDHLIREGPGAYPCCDSRARGGAARVCARRFGREAGAEAAHVEDAVARRGVDRRTGPASQPDVFDVCGRRWDVGG